MSTDFQEGDLVEAVKGERVVRDRISKDEDGDLFILGVGHLTNCFFPEGGNQVVRQGFTLTLIERPKPKVELPTGRGFYIDKTGDAWLLGHGGKLHLLTNTFGSSPASEQARADYDSLAAEHAPFTRLESRADTAKAVIGWFADVPWGRRVEDYPDVLNSARAHFGVTDA